MSQTNSYKRLAVTGYAVIIGTFIGGGAWAFTSSIDEAVIAPGFIDIASSRKIVQHLEGGIVGSLSVSEGQSVRRGDTLLVLATQSATSNSEVMRQRVEILSIEESRLVAERDGQSHWPITHSELEVAGKENAQIFKSRREVLSSQIDILNAQVDQLAKEEEVILAQRSSFEARVAVLGLQLDRLRSGEAKGIIQTNVVSISQDEFIEVRSNVDRLTGEAAKVRQSIAEKELMKVLAVRQYTERAVDELKDVKEKLWEAKENLKVAQDTLERNTIRASTDGTVENLAIHTIGGVVQPGQTLMEIVPENEELIVKARVSPSDIDSVAAGMKAEVRFPSIPSRFVPIVERTVLDVSRSVTTGSDHQERYFTVKVKLDRGKLPELVQKRLRIDMPVEVVIAKGERSVADFLISPLADAVRKSLREE